MRAASSRSHRILSRLFTYGAGWFVAASVAGCFYVPPISAPVEDADTPPFVLEVERVRLVDLSLESDVRFDVAQIYDRNPAEDIDYAFLYDAAFVRRGRAAFTLEASTGQLIAAPDQTLTDLTTYLGVETRVDFCDEQQINLDVDRPSAMRLVLIDPLPASQRGTAGTDPLANVDAFIVEVTWRLEFVGACP